MRTITITGDDRHIENVVKENRGRVDRGFLTIEEVSTEAPKVDSKKVADPKKGKVVKVDSKKVVTDTKKAPAADTKDVNPETK